MLFSILVPGKNDNFRKNNSKVLKFSLEQIIQNIEDLGIDDVELVLCDWGSEKKIVDEIVTKKHQNFKCVYVSPQIAEKYNGDWNYSIVHPINTAFRHSTGKYAMYMDSDCFTSPSDFKKLYEFVQNMDKTNDLKFYWGSRLNVPREYYSDFNSPNQLVNYFSDNPDLDFFVDNMNNMGENPNMEIGGFLGGGITMLMNRFLWESSTGWFEELPYWGFQDVEFHNRLLQRFQYGGSLRDFGINFYHLLPTPKHIDHRDLSQTDKHPNMKRNPHHCPKQFVANPSNWGLADELLEVI